MCYIFVRNNKLIKYIDMKKTLKILAGILVLFFAVVLAVVGIKYGGSFGGAVVICNVLFVAHFLYYWKKDMAKASFAVSAQSGMSVWCFWALFFLLYGAEGDKTMTFVLFTFLVVASGLYLWYICEDFSDYLAQRKIRHKLNSHMRRWIKARNQVWGLPPADLETMMNENYPLD